MVHIPKIAGILNATPDSFSDGGRYNEPTDAVPRVTELFNQGASLVDIGAQSTKPGATPLTADEEWSRLEPILSEILPAYPDSISIDTFHPEVVRRAAQLGNFIINDVTAFNNPEMRELAAELQFTIIVSHLPESANQDIQRAHQEKEVHSANQVYDELLNKADQLIGGGVLKESIILDPGIGFGKTGEVNWQLLAFGALVPEYQVMIGYSRKKFLGPNRMSLIRNLEAAAIAAEHTAYLRVHDVAGHYEYLRNRQGQL